MGPKDREAVPLHYLEIIYPSPLRLKNAFDVCGGFIAVCCQVGDAVYLDTKFPFMYLLVCDTITAVRVCTLQKMMQRINQQLYQEEYKLIGISILIFIFVVHSWPSLTWMSLFVDSPRFFLCIAGISAAFRNWSGRIWRRAELLPVRLYSVVEYRELWGMPATSVKYKEYIRSLLCVYEVLKYLCFKLKP